MEKSYAADKVNALTGYFEVVYSWLGIVSRHSGHREHPTNRPLVHLFGNRSAGRVIATIERTKQRSVALHQHKIYHESDIITN